MQLLDKMWGNCEFYQLIQGYPGGVVLFGIRGEILEVNGAFVELIGCPSKQIYQHKYTDISSTDSHATEAQMLKTQAFVRGFTDVYEKKYQVENQTPVIVNQHVYLIRDNAGNPQFMLAMLVPPSKTSPTSKNASSEGANADALNREIDFLKNQNGDLQNLVQQTQARLDASEGTKKLEKSILEKECMQAELEDAQKVVADLEAKLSRKDTALEWKDTAISELEQSKKTLEDEILALKGALDVAQIVEVQKENPPESAAEEQLPWEVAPMVPEQEGVSAGDSEGVAEDSEGAAAEGSEDVFQEETAFAANTHAQREEAPFPDVDLLMDSPSESTENEDVAPFPAGDAEDTPSLVASGKK